MTSGFRWAGILAGGVGLAFLLDPRKGGIRRADLRDEARHISARTRVGWLRFSRELRDRMAEARDRVRRAVRPERGAFDTLIREHVRTAIEAITHSGKAVDIRVHDGRVTLSGRVHAVEIQPILDAVSAIPEVVSVEDQLHLREPLRNPPKSRSLGSTLARPARWWPLIAIVVGTVSALRPPPG